MLLYSGPHSSLREREGGRERKGDGGREIKRRGEGGERGGGKEPQKSVWTTFSGFLHFHL